MVTNDKEWRKQASNQPTNQMIYTFTFYDSSLTHAVSRSHSFQHLKVPAIFLSGPDAIYFFLPLPANSSIFFIGFCWCVLSCACHFNSFTSRSCFLSLSCLSQSSSLTFYVCLPVALCLFACISHMPSHFKTFFIHIVWCAICIICLFPIRNSCPINILGHFSLCLCDENNLKCSL